MPQCLNSGRPPLSLSFLICDEWSRAYLLASSWTPAFLSPKPGMPPQALQPAPEEKGLGRVQPRVQVTPAGDTAGSGVDAAALRRGDPTATAGGAGTVQASAAEAEANAREVVCGVRPHHADRARPASPARAHRSATLGPRAAPGLLRFVRLVPHGSGFSRAPGRWAGRGGPGELAPGGPCAGGGCAASPVRQRPE